MTDELFKEIFERTRVLLWFIFGCVVVGAFIENKLAVLVGTFMILSLSAVYIVAKFIKNPTKR